MYFDNRFTLVILQIMKIAINVPDDLFTQAEHLAEHMQISNSELYVRALDSYMRQYQGEWITNKLNDVYTNLDSSLDPVIAGMQFVSLPRDDNW